MQAEPMSELIHLVLRRRVLCPVVPRQTEYEINTVPREALEDHALVDLSADDRVGPQRIVMRPSSGQAWRAGRVLVFIMASGPDATHSCSAHGTLTSHGRCPEANRGGEPRLARQAALPPLGARLRRGRAQVRLVSLGRSS